MRSKGKLLGSRISDILTRRCPPWWLGKHSGAKLFWVVSPTRSIASPRQIIMGTDHISRKTPAFSSYLLQTRLEATRFTRNSGNSHRRATDLAYPTFLPTALGGYYHTLFILSHTFLFSL